MSASEIKLQARPKRGVSKADLEQQLSSGKLYDGTIRIPSSFDISKAISELTVCEDGAPPSFDDVDKYMTLNNISFDYEALEQASKQNMGVEERPAPPPSVEDLLPSCFDFETAPPIETPKLFPPLNEPRNTPQQNLSSQPTSASNRNSSYNTPLSNSGNTYVPAYLTGISTPTPNSSSYPTSNDNTIRVHSSRKSLPPAPLTNKPLPPTPQQSQSNYQSTSPQGSYNAQPNYQPTSPQGSFNGQYQPSSPHGSFSGQVNYQGNSLPQSSYNGQMNYQTSPCGSLNGQPNYQGGSFNGIPGNNSSYQVGYNPPQSNLYGNDSSSYLKRGSTPTNPVNLYQQNASLLPQRPSSTQYSGQSNYHSAVSAATSQPIVAPAIAKVPSDWEQKQTPDGRIFYLDHSEKKTHWEPPEGWSIRKTANGRLYYLHHTTKTTHWSLPPPGWDVCKTSDGRVFFADHVNKKTSWTLPTA